MKRLVTILMALALLLSLCAGCGRCIEKCPGHLDITEFISRAAEVTR